MLKTKKEMKVIKDLTASKPSKKKEKRKGAKRRNLLVSPSIEGNSPDTFVDGVNYRELLYLQAPEIKDNPDCIKLLEQNIVVHYKITNNLVFIRFKDFSIKINRIKNEFIIITDDSTTDETN